MKIPVIDIFHKIESIKKLKEEVHNLNSPGKIYSSNLSGSAKSMFINEIGNSEKQIIILCTKKQILNEIKVELSLLDMRDQIIAVEDLNQNSIQEMLTDLNNKEKCILISTYDILKTPMPHKSELDKFTTVIETGGELTYDDIIEYFGMLNYEREKYIDAPGYFAVRGSIIDFWSYSEKQPVRLEFDGDFLESIRYFDPESQRSANRTERVTLAAQIENDSEKFSHIFDYLDNPLVLASNFELQNLFDPLIKKEAEEENYIDDLDDELKSELFDDENKEQLIDEDNLEIKNSIPISLTDLFEKNVRWLIEDELGESNERINLKLNEAPLINSNFEVLFSVIKEHAEKSYQIIITVENELQGRRLIELLSDYNNELHDIVETGKVKINVLPIKSGFVSKTEKLLVLSDYQVFNKPYRTKLSSKYKKKKSRVKDFASLQRGDFVVHETFGIGQYDGLQTIKIGSVDQESIKILYAEGGVVYVNLNYLNLVKKFSSRDNVRPKLSVLGSNEWKSTKKKVKSKIKEAARGLIMLYAKRKASEGYSFSDDSIWQKELEASFFYEDTVDQAKVSEEVKTDMQNKMPMDRLVCGDVGFGKTEIAVRAAFKTVQDGKQVALLVPTTILCEQHHNTFEDRLQQFPVKVEALSRFQTKKEQTEIIEKLENGEVDIVIGTHRLLSKDIKFKDLGLLIIDEEHRFGVMAKEKLRSLKANVDTLTLTATPIPRTLNLSLLGARDLSIIATPPPNRQPIYTKVDKFEINNIRNWVLNEIKREGQIYFVHDRVQSIDKIAAYINRHIPEINIGVAHGQMKPSHLEKVIYDFLNKKFHMLISTKIIESGLDIPNVNTIIVNRADRFGLAELHQLRGRVGRSDRQAHAFFLVPSLNTISKKAVRRLQAIEEYTELGEGFSLSMRDLEIRGAGNLLGTEQSGAIDTVGFDMYLKLVDEAVEELKQDEFKEEFKDLLKHIERADTNIDTYFEIGIPKEFMPDQADRLSFYTGLFSIIKIDELSEVREEMVDRFGKLPKIIERMIAVAALKFYASYALFERVIILTDRVTFVLPKPENEDFYKNKFTGLMEFIVEEYPKDVHFRQDKNTMKLVMKNPFSSPEQIMEKSISFCKEVMNKIDQIVPVEMELVN